MRPAFTVIFLVSLSLFILSGSDSLYPMADQAPAAAVSTTTNLDISLDQLPLYFIKNLGQLNERVAYTIKGRDKTLYFTPEGITFVLDGVKSQTTIAPERYVLKLDFVGANPVWPVGTDSTSAVISYFKGGPDTWQTGVPTYSQIVYHDLWPGIDLVYGGTVNELKYTFLVQPGADPTQIRLAYRGASGVKINEGGQLEVSTPINSFYDDKPYVYQEVKGQQVEIDSNYILTQYEEGYIYGFEIGAYDRSKPLLLDPAVVVYAGFIGGGGEDSGSGIAVDTAGNAYVTGQTRSSEATFPEQVGPDLSYADGGSDAFVAKVKADGSGLDYAGYIGGSGEEGGLGIAVDAAGNAYVTGFTFSSETTFPVLVGPDPTFNGGGSDAFVTKVNPTGTGLVYSGYIGGSGPSDGEIGTDIVLDSLGNAYVAGTTSATEATFPVMIGPDLSYNGGSSDGFVAKIKADGSGFDYAGYIGGSGSEAVTGIVVDGAGNAYVTGITNSTEGSFPVAVGPDLDYNGGSNDAFVAKVKVDGSGLDYAGYIGGAGEDHGNGIDLDGGGNLYISGTTDSDQTTFPVMVGPDLIYNGNPQDAYIARVKADGSGLDFAGYIGGSSGDRGADIAVQGSIAYLIGDTNSSEATFPVKGGPDLTYNGSRDAFVAQIQIDNGTLTEASYLGDSGEETGVSIAVDSKGAMYVTGFTASANFPMVSGPDLSPNGGRDAFVAKIEDDMPPPPTTLYLPLVMRDYCPPLTNGDFETGNLGGWQSDQGPFAGHGSGLPAKVAPFEAGHSARINDPAFGNGGVPVGYGSVSRCFPVEKQYLTFRYRVITYDIVQGSSTGRYFDSFEVLLNIPPPQISDSERNNKGCRTTKLNPTGTLIPADGLLFCGGSGAGVSDGTVLVDTGWKTVTLDLQNYQNGNITLYFSLWNREYNPPAYNDQGIYNSWAYIDDVKFSDTP